LLGWHYFYGIGVTENDDAAFKWTRAAAVQDDPAAEQLLAVLYAGGHGVEQSEVDAFKWNYPSAQRDNAEAEGALGWDYHNGYGVARDDRTAFAWEHRSAEQGNPYGAWVLSSLYETGQGVPRNMAEAYRWIRVAQAGLPKNLEIQKTAAILSLGAFVETQDFATVDVSLVLLAFHREITIAFAVLAFIYVALGMSLLAHGLATSAYPLRLWQAFAWAAFFMESQFVALLAILLFGNLLSANLLLTSIVVLGAFPLVISSLGRTRRQVWRPSTGNWKTLLLFAVSGYAVFMTVTVGYEALYRAVTGSSFPYQPTFALISKAKDSSAWIAYASIAIALPTAEEVLFRGYFFDALRKRFSGLFVVVATAFGFSIYHFQGFYILPLFAFGLVLGFLKLRTNSLFPGLAVHVLNNALMLAFGG
jgi:membrane protease YdiL (CAAX protease family)